MKIFDRFNPIRINELAEWLAKYVSFDDAPWWKWWDKNYCRKCESVTAYLPYLDKETQCAWCEANCGCRFFPQVDSIPDEKEIIKMWLNSEEEDDE